MIEAVGKDLDNMIASHEAQIKILSEQMGNVNRKIDTVIHDIHLLSTTITTQAARPSFDIVKIITLTKDIGLSIGLVVAAIVYITGASFSAQFYAIDELKKDVQELRLLLKGSSPDAREFPPG